MAKATLGFDFGSNSLRIAKVAGSHVVKTVDFPLPDNIIREGAMVSYDAMADVIREAVKTNKLGGCRAAVIIPSRYVVLRRFEMPLMTIANLKTNLPYEFHDYLDMDKDKYYYDYLVNEIVKEDPKDVASDDFDEKTQGPRMDLTAAAVPKEIIKEYRSMFKAAGVMLETAIPVECAYANILKFAKVPADRESCFINLGASVSCVNFYKGSVFQTNRIKDTGISTAENIIAEDNNLDIHMAREYFKANHNNVQNDENVKTVYNAVSADLRKTINFYKFSNRDSEISDAYCHGAGSKIQAFKDAVVDTCEISLKPLTGLLPKIKDGSDGDDFALAIGCALQAGR